MPVIPETVPITAGSGTPVAVDDLAGTKIQANKIILGADGVADAYLQAGLLDPASAAAVVQAVGTLVTNRSGTTSGTINTSTQVMPAKTTRRFLFIQNLSTADMWFNFTAAATAGQPSFKLSPNDALILDGSCVPTDAINVLSGLATQPYCAKEI